MRPHGWAGIAIVLLAEAALALGHPLVGRWFTPIVWTGYVLAADAVVFRLTGRSYLTTARLDLVLVALASVGCWWLFEWYNAPRFWRGGDELIGLWWQYHRMEPNLFLRRVGYDWAFATIFPALFLTAAALLIHRRERFSYSAEMILKYCAGVAAAIAFVTTIEHLTGWNLRIDQLLVSDPDLSAAPGRMSLATAACLMFVNVAILIADIPGRYGIAQLLVAGAGMLATLSGVPCEEAR